MRIFKLSTSILALIILPHIASAQTTGQAFPATLAGHAVMPAESFVDAPVDAPTDLKTSGKFTRGTRVHAVGTIEGKSFDRPTGVKIPFKGQALQGHSGIKKMADGTFWVLTDNGFGSKATSPDSMLFLNRYRIDWSKGTLEKIETIFLHDPDKRSPSVSPTKPLKSAI